MSWIETYTGRRFELSNPSFCIEDIAQGLSNIARFNGQCKFLSVAEHSLAVADLMTLEGEGDPFEGLMHDAVEAYLSDVPSPFKSLLPDWSRFEDNCDRALRRDFYLPETKSEACHKADTMMLFCEAHFLLPNKGRNFSEDPSLRFRMEPLYDVFRPMGLPPGVAKSYFLKRFEELGGPARLKKGLKLKSGIG